MGRTFLLIFTQIEHHEIRDRVIYSKTRGLWHIILQSLQESILKFIFIQTSNYFISNLTKSS